jgi:hypothetical protein
MLPRRRALFGERLAALIAGLALVAEKAGRLSASSTLVAGLALVAKLARRLIGESRAGHANPQGGTEHKRLDLAFHGLLLPEVFDPLKGPVLVIETP